jgi:hypothetical protein
MFRSRLILIAITALASVPSGLAQVSEISIDSKVMAFIVLSSIASVFLLAAVPFRFSESNWSIFWLLEAEVLFLTGLRMKESVFRRLGFECPPLLR